MITIEVPVEHRFAVGDVIQRLEPPVDCPIPSEEQKSVWRVVEVGCSPPYERSGVYVWDGPWYRLSPVNDIARLMWMNAHARTAPAAPWGLLGPVTERVRSVDRQCEPHV